MFDQQYRDVATAHAENETIEIVDRPGVQAGGWFVHDDETWRKRQRTRYLN